MKKLMIAPLLLSAVFATAGCNDADAKPEAKETVIRHGLIGSDFPILRASEVPATSTIVFLKVPLIVLSCSSPYSFPL